MNLLLNFLDVGILNLYLLIENVVYDIYQVSVFGLVVAPDNLLQGFNVNFVVDVLDSAHHAFALLTVGHLFHFIY